MQSSPTERHFGTEPNNLLLTSKLLLGMLAQAVTPRTLTVLTLVTCVVSQSAQSYRDGTLK
jgi:hypothetical protein